jgi:hypothetical protein
MYPENGGTTFPVSVARRTEVMNRVGPSPWLTASGASHTGSLITM